MTPLNFAIATAFATGLSVNALAVSAHDVRQDASTMGEEVMKLGAAGIEQLSEAARNFGLRDRPVPDSYVEVSAGGMIFQAMSLESFTNVSAGTIYEEPVNFGIAYYNARASGLEPGQYLMQVQSSEQIEKPGRYGGVVTLVTGDGEPVAKIETELEVFSMEPAAMSGWEGTVITPSFRYAEEMVDGFRNPVVAAGIWCTNGLHIDDVIVAIR